MGSSVWHTWAIHQAMSPEADLTNLSALWDLWHIVEYRIMMDYMHIIFILMFGMVDMENKSKGIDNETLDKVAKEIMTRNKMVFDRLAEI